MLSLMLSLKARRSSGWWPTSGLTPHQSRLQKEVIRVLFQFSDVISIGGYEETNLISHAITVNPGTLNTTDNLSCLAGSCVFSALDGAGAFHAIPV